MQTSLPLRLSFNELRHGWRHFSVFLACLMLGVMVMGLVGMMSAAVQHALEREKHSLLGGDIEVLAGNQAIDSAQLKELKAYGMVSHIATLRSMLQFGDLPTLVEIKAVDANYPVLGKIQLQENMAPEAALAGDGVVVDAALLAQLGAKLGDTVSIGSKQLVLRATLKREPDRAVQLLNFGPRVMMRYETLESTGLVTPTSLMKQRYRIKLATPEHARAVADEILSHHQIEGWGVVTEADGNSLLRRFFDQLTAFLSLAGLATFLIAGIGIGSSVRAYLQKKTRSIATLKIFGASRAHLLFTYGLVLGLLALAGSIVGVAVAGIGAYFLLPLLSQWLPVAREGSVFIDQGLIAVWYGLLITYLFSLPALLGMLQVRPALLFRSRSAPLPAHRSWWLAGVSLVLMGAIVGTLLVTVHDRNFIGGALGLVLLAFLLFSACAWLAKAVARRMHSSRPWLRLALGNIHRPGATTGTIIFALGISLSLLIALTLTEANFQARVSKIAKEKAPTLFMIDIQPFEKEAVRAELEASAGAGNVAMQPMLRARIAALHGVPVREHNVKPEAHWAVRSDRGLTYAAALPANAVLAEGAWWPADYRGPALVSVDQRFLDGLGVKVGDHMTLEVQGEKIEAKIANARRIDYTTFQINFSMILSPGILEEYPQTWLATVFQPDEEKEKALLRQLSRGHPGMTIIRTSEAVALVREVTSVLSLVLRATVLVSLLAGLMVLASTLGAAMEERKQETAILKILGATRRDLLKTLSAEWVLLALITSALSAGLGILGAWLFLQRFPGSDFSPMPGLLLGMTLLCCAVLWLTGYASNRRLFAIRPARLLRGE